MIPHSQNDLFNHFSIFFLKKKPCSFSFMLSKTKSILFSELRSIKTPSDVEVVKLLRNSIF